MYKIVGFSLLVILVAMVVPVASSIDSDAGLKQYGMAELSLKDVTGLVIFENVIHNEVLDYGTGFMLNQTFNDADGVDVAEANQIDHICVTDAATVVVLDTEKIADFIGDASTILGSNGNGCKTTAFVVTATTATSATLNFAADDTSFANDSTVTGIGICTGAGSDNDVCETINIGLLFAVVDTSDVTVGTGESVDITYTLTLD